MTEEEKIKLKIKYANVVNSLGPVNGKIQELKNNILSFEALSTKTLLINDKICEYEKVDSIKTELTTAISMINDTIIPSLNRKINE